MTREGDKQTYMYVLTSLQQGIRYDIDDLASVADENAEERRREQVLPVSMSMMLKSQPWGYG